MERAALQALARFQSCFNARGFSAGEMIARPSKVKGIHEMPYASYDENVESFIRAAYAHDWVRPDFDWPSWMESAEAVHLLEDAGAIEQADAGQLSKMLTVLIRRDRFSEGSLLAAFERGLVQRIVQRAAAIVGSGMETSGAS